eukprot:CAMPEP_0118896536 /NCGR_PEP_ID=MMETSP1166-20130328/4356_1 /TAXON_ID=1104430 /ORGANISM="Chrysoreinhardia sp, Strain CCMP3193" /LENGTH=173 /DNA_ID=CAMNT_0006835595 /DNA_START=45 /DNA_END=567 /DNA_ORIENTATION=+
MRVAPAGPGREAVPGEDLDGGGAAPRQVPLEGGDDARPLAHGPHADAAPAAARRNGEPGTEGHHRDEAHAVAGASEQGRQGPHAEETPVPREAMASPFFVFTEEEDEEEEEDDDDLVETLADAVFRGEKKPYSLASLSAMMLDSEFGEASFVPTEETLRQHQPPGLAWGLGRP